jgi:UTP--glucose-1-phosphate uridylyltransferase
MTNPSYPELSAFIELMNREEMPDKLISSFSGQYKRYRDGDSGKVPWAEISSPEPKDIVEHTQMAQPDAARAKTLCGKLVCVKLNGGLGTTMQLSGPKSVIPVRDGRSFLRIIADHVERLRERHDVQVPLMLMDSFRTREPSLAELAGFEQPHGLPLDFLQHKVPRIDAHDNAPAALSDQERWAPPGHGDIYLAMALSGALEQLIAAGYEWAFVSNADNLGATVDLAIVDHLDRHGLDFAMEVTPKTEADRKGGTLVRRAGHLTLLERAQVESDRIADFEDISKFTVFNTNSLWWRLSAVAEKLRQGELVLPLIVNPKQKEGKDVIQLETAMGAGVSCFDRSVGVRVSRRRFAPVKATCDLLGVRSDAYIIDDVGGLRPSPERTISGPPIIELDNTFFQGFADFERRCANVPSLVKCRKLTVEGDVLFEPGVVIEGDVSIINASDESKAVAANSVLRDQQLRL